MSLQSAEMMEEFRIEMADIAQGLDETLLRWERDPENPDLPERIFRQLHTLKGSSGFLEMFDLADLCHAAEDVFSALRKGKELPVPTVLALITETVSLARHILSQPLSGSEHPQLRGVTARIRAFLASAGEPHSLTEAESVRSEASSGVRSTRPTPPVPRESAGESDAQGSEQERSEDTNAEALAPEGGSVRRVSAIAPRYGTRPVRRPSQETARPANPRRSARITNLSPLSPAERAGLLSSALLGSSPTIRPTPPAPEATALGPWSQERLEALNQGRTAAELKGEGSRSPVVAGPARPERIGVELEVEPRTAGTPPSSRVPTQDPPGAEPDALELLLSQETLPRDINDILGHDVGRSSAYNTGEFRIRTSGSFQTLRPDPSPAPTPATPLSNGQAPVGVVSGAASPMASGSGVSASTPTPGGALTSPAAAPTTSVPPVFSVSPTPPPAPATPGPQATGGGRGGTSRRAIRTLGTDLKVPPQPLPEANSSESLSLTVQGMEPVEPHSDTVGSLLHVSGAAESPLKLELAAPDPLQAQESDELRAEAGRAHDTSSDGDWPGASLTEPATSSTLDETGLFIERAATVRVDVAKLDSLLNLMGDLLQEKHRQSRLVDELMARDSEDPTAVAISHSHRRFERLLGDVQDAVLSTRMLPVQGVFRRYPRIVRDLATRLGKEVELTIAGEQTELDRALLEGLFDPLIHLLRNSIDHGIEAPLERVRRNKPRRGTISLSASQEGNQIVLEIKDDGRGIDSSEMVERAVMLKLLNPDRAKELNEQEKIDLIFLPGFTSRPEVTETSGRGVGMSVVRDHLRRIGGLITVHSHLGEGTTLRIAMPLTLAILQVLLVRVGGSQYAIPLSSVMGAHRVEREQLTLYRGGWYLPRPGSMLPIFSLATLLGTQPPHLPPERCYLAEVGVAEKRYGVWVEGFDGIYESVIKSLEGSLTRLPGVAGGTFIGSGELVLVLDVGTLLEGQMAQG